jgi:hypothetical protein
MDIEGNRVQNNGPDTACTAVACIGVLSEAAKEGMLMREVEDVENTLGGHLKM